jgi:hypothetical protein
MTDSINKKLHANDKKLENRNAKLDDFSSAIKNQLSFNKMLESQLAQLAAAIPSFEKGRIPGKPEEFMETANLVTSRYDFGLDGWGVPIKKGDPGSPIITCSIGPHTFQNEICDLGSSVNIMSKETYENLFYTNLAPTSVYLQLADQSVRYVEGIATDLLVGIRDAYVPANFAILDMGNDKDTPLILGRPFLDTTNACIYVASGRIQFHLAGKKETFVFTSRKPIFYEKQVGRSNQRRRTPKSQSQLRKRKSPARISRSQEGHGARRTHHLHHRRLILRTSLKKIRTKSTRTRKMNPRARRDSCELALEGTLLLHCF